MTKTSPINYIQAALDNDPEALVDGIKFIFNAREAHVDPDGSVWIAGPMAGHWLDDADIAAVETALEAGVI